MSTAPRSPFHSGHARQAVLLPVLVCLFFLFAPQAPAADSEPQRVDLGLGVSIALPKEWPREGWKLGGAGALPEGTDIWQQEEITLLEAWTEARGYLLMYVAPFKSEPFSTLLPQESKAGGGAEDFPFYLQFAAAFEMLGGKVHETYPLRVELVSGKKAWVGAVLVTLEGDKFLVTGYHIPFPEHLWCLLTYVPVPDDANTKEQLETARQSVIFSRPDLTTE